MKKYIIFLICNIPFVLFGQINDFAKYKGESVKTYSLVAMQDCFFMEYNDSLDRAYASYKLKDSLQNSTPEKLLTSLYSAQNKSWLNEYYQGTNPDISENDLKRRSMADSSNYFQLIHKLTFNYNGIQTAIVKYAECINNVKAGFYACQMQNINGKWVFVRISEISNIEAAIKSLKTTYFNVFVSGSKTDNKDINDLIKNTREQMRVLNITKLSNELKVLKNNNSVLYTIICDN